MSKYLSFLLTMIYGSAFAITNNEAFQKFDNQYSIGYAFTQGTLINGAHNTVSYSTEYVNLEVEHLFDVGIWFDANLGMVTAYGQPNLGSLNGGNGSSQPFGQYPFLNALTAKAGYAFPLLGQSLQLTPYVLFGRTANWATSTIIANGMENLANDYFYTGGLGGRASYRINDSIMLYFDELYAYNWDNSGAIKHIQIAEYGKSYAATNYTFTTTLGAKFNITPDFQVGVNGFWNNFQVQSNIAGVMYTPTNTFGGMLSLGLTY